MTATTGNLTIIVAVARNGVIGAGATLPWHLPEELQHFKASTMGHAVIMGRKTFESIGKPLPGRRIIVVTRSADWSPAGCEAAASLCDAIELCRQPHPLMTNSREVFVAGGAQVYEQAVPLANRMLITQIDLAPDGDVHFAMPDPALWRLHKSSDHLSRIGVHYQIQDWERIVDR